MLKKILPIIAFSIVLSPVIASAEWIDISENDQTILAVEKKLIVKSNQTIFFWQRLMYKEVQPGNMKFAITYNEVDCKLIAVKIRKSIIYNESGETLSKEEYDPVDFDQQVPDSLGEKLLQAICQ